MAKSAPAPAARPAPGTTPNILVAVIAVACLFFGGVLGYVIGNRPSHGDSAPVAATAPAGAPAPSPAVPQATAVVNESQVQALKSILATDPKNVSAAESLGNLYYDAGRFQDAIPYYQQAFVLDSRNVNLSTDLGTALWYSGRADDAVGQYEKSLAIDPNHPNTLMNLGIVKRDGTHDPAGAVAAWEKLLQTNPSFGDRAKVERLIGETKGAAANQPMQPLR